MFITRSDQVQLPFSLECYSCDAGMELRSVEEAQAADWTEIQEDADGMAWNYLGRCPECARLDSRIL